MVLAWWLEILESIRSELADIVEQTLAGLDFEVTPIAAVTTLSTDEKAIKIQIGSRLRHAFATLRAKQGNVTVFGHGRVYVALQVLFAGMVPCDLRSVVRPQTFPPRKTRQRLCRRARRRSLMSEV